MPQIRRALLLALALTLGGCTTVRSPEPPRAAAAPVGPDAARGGGWKEAVAWAAIGVISAAAIVLAVAPQE